MDTRPRVRNRGIGDDYFLIFCKDYLDGNKNDRLQTKLNGNFNEDRPINTI